jgi:hypothetical protein
VVFVGTHSGPLQVLQVLFFLLDYPKDAVSDVDGKPSWTKIRAVSPPLHSMPCLRVFVCCVCPAFGMLPASPAAACQ